ncbi:MAG: hypothetical protein RSF67_00960 [Clostridia bacterium]
MEYTNENIEQEIREINEKLDKILKHQNWEKEQWEKDGSFSTFMKRWGGFYIASLLADETLLKR